MLRGQLFKTAHKELYWMRIGGEPTVHEEEMVKEIIHESPLRHSDHFVLTCICYRQKPDCCKPSKGDYDSTRKDLDIRG